MQDLLEGLTGKLGSAAQYAAFHRSFCAIPLLGPVTHFINAPFGRFSVSSRFNVNGNIAWFLFEIVSPVTFALSLLGGPLRNGDRSPWALLSSPVKDMAAKAIGLTTPTKLLAAFYLVHYANRSTISGLRTPQPRSPIHPIVILSAVVFNVLNGTLMGTWLGGRTSASNSLSGAVPEAALSTPLFWIGCSMWAAGFLGNLLSDEVLYNLRRSGKDGKPPPRYSIPRGFLYDKPFGGISFPAYFSEWVEWLGFAIAACAYSPAPALPGSTAGKLAHAIVGGTSINYLFQASTYARPPFLFFFAEIATMLPRALKGHAWYKQKFGEDFPSDRKAIIPGVL